MATSQTADSLSKLSSEMRGSLPTINSKDVDSLINSIDNLTKILNKRTGKFKKPSNTPNEDNDDKPRTLFGDIKDFGKGFISQAAETKKYVFGGKNTMPKNLDLNNKNESEEKNESKVLTLSQFKNELLKIKNTEFEKNLLAEVVVIRKIIALKSGLGDAKSTIPQALTGSGLEPNLDEEKQKDRELLAEAIADKLKNLGNAGGIGGIDIFGPPKPKVPPTAKTPGKMGLRGKLGLAGKLLGGAGLALGAYEASEFLGETGYGDKMAAGAGKDAEKAFRENVAPTIDPVKMGMTPEEARNALGGSNRDIEKLGGKEALLKIANTDFESSGSSKDLKEQIRIKEQSLKTSGPMLNNEYRDKLQTDIDTLKKRMSTADMPDQTAAETARLNSQIKNEPISTKEFPNKMRDEKKTLGMVREDGATLTHIGGNDGKPDVWQKSEKSNQSIPSKDLPDQTTAETARLNRYNNIETKQSPITAEGVNSNKTNALEGNLDKSITNNLLKQLEVPSTGDKKYDFLKKIENENMDLKNSSESISQILAPMISNRTVDNSTQTFVTSPPKPYPTMSGYNPWQSRVDGKL